ncbi:MAG: rRNA maturation RNase YbeY [Ilumatobacteraceae bacterium]
MEGSRPTLARRRKVGGDGELEVFCADEQTAAPVDVARWRSLAEAVVLAEGVRGAAELSVVFVDEDTIAELNEEYLDKAGPTDVLAFPLDVVEADIATAPGGASRGPHRAPVDLGELPLLLGDVVVCPAVALRQAPTHAGTLDDELALLVTHGVLHVLGWDHADDDERAAMQARERDLLEALHWKGPAPAGFRQDHDE